VTSEPTRTDRAVTTAVKTLDRDSRARTHLANERTFLAWLRTGLSLVALGLATAQFLERQTPFGWDVATPLSVLLIVGGTAMTAVGGRRFVSAGHAIEDGSYVPSVGAITVAVAFAALAGLAALLFVVLQR
jgi:putative membrane protein